MSRMLRAAAGGVLLHRMRPPLYLGSDWARKITANPLLSPLLPEGFCVHILPVDYQRCQSRALHSSCCPHCGSGANLSRQHRGRRPSHPAWRSRAPSESSPLVSAETHSNHAPVNQQAARALCLPHRLLPCGAFKQEPKSKIGKKATMIFG